MSERDWAFGLGPTVEQENREKAWADASRIRDTLHANPYAVIYLECFSRAEADQIRALLTPEEAGSVLFLWMAEAGPHEH